MVDFEDDVNSWDESEEGLVFYKEGSTKINDVFLDRVISVENKDAEYILKIKYKHDETIVKIVKIPISYQEYRWGSMTGRADELEQDEHFLEESEW